MTDPPWQPEPCANIEFDFDEFPTACILCDGEVLGYQQDEEDERRMEEEHLGRDEVNGGAVGGTRSWVDGKVEEEKEEETEGEDGSVYDEETQGDEETEDDEGAEDEEETEDEEGTEDGEETEDEEDSGVDGDEETQEEVESDGEWLPATKRRRLN
ncbi:hypothetical protein MMC08_006214 [Hypocenomyce scalaris]|nr:hypothetical protein [Hypocenomyce scalaris]